MLSVQGRLEKKLNFNELVKMNKHRTACFYFYFLLKPGSASEHLSI